MLHRRLADTVVIVHCLVAAYFLLGAVLARSYPWTALIHIPLAVWVSSAFIMGWTCPLTPLENRLRKAAGARGYEGSFVDHYFGALLGLRAPKAADSPDSPAPPAPSKTGRRNEIALGVFFIVLTLGPHIASLGRYHEAIWPSTFINLPGVSDENQDR